MDEVTRLKERTRKKRYYWQNREKMRARARRYYTKNKEKITKRQREWKKRNPEKVRDAFRRSEAKKFIKRKKEAHRRFTLARLGLLYEVPKTEKPS